MTLGASSASGLSQQFGCPPEQLQFVLVEDARRWVASFVAWYNDDHQHSGIRFVTPSQRHAGHDTAILAHRDVVYRDARRRHPSRWSGGTRNWTPIATVRLNPEHGLNN